MKNKNKLKQSGFTLVEVLIVLVIIAVLATIAIIGLGGVKKAVGDKVAETRLTEISKAQMQFRVALGKKRFATLSELAAAQTASGPLVSETVLKLGGDGASQPIDGWRLSDTSPSTAGYLNTHFDISLISSATTDPVFCIHEDGVIRKADAGQTCSRTSPAIPLN